MGLRAVLLLLAALGLAVTLAGCMGDEGVGPGNDAAEAPLEDPVEEPVAQPGGENGDAPVGFSAIPDIVQEVEPSVVAIELGQGQGSGVIWDADGLIVTNHHVVEGANEVGVVFASGRRSTGQVRASDPMTDLAIVEVDENGLPAAEFADELPRVGELAVAIGNPLGFANTVTAGIVSGLNRALPAQGPQAQALIDLIQTDAGISPGNSGGALVNGQGRVIGINVAYIPPQARAVSIGFAIPATTVVDVVEELLEDGTVQHAFLGVQPAALTPQIVERFDLDVDRGVVVLSVVEGSAAEEAGLQPGDVLVAIDGEALARIEDLFAFLRQRDPGDVVELRLVRNGEEQTLEATLGERAQ